MRCRQFVNQGLGLEVGYDHLPLRCRFSCTRQLPIAGPSCLGSSPPTPTIPGEVKYMGD